MKQGHEILLDIISANDFYPVTRLITFTTPLLLQLNLT